MNRQNVTHYRRIEQAIRFIRKNFKHQPSLDEIAESVHLSPFHFQKLFKDWAGVSPKKFLQYTSLEYAKSRLSQGQGILEATYETGYSSASRLHDLFISTESMTPADYKRKGAGLNIQYQFAQTQFGLVVVASTEKGICFMAFADTKAHALSNLKARFPKAVPIENQNQYHEQALAIYFQDWSKLETIKLHLAGTPFQLKVWHSLLHIPLGALTTYSNIAADIENPRAVRAVGTAIGANPISFLIPCHRVIQSSGELGGYRWGLDRKLAMIGWEAKQVSSED